METSIIPSAEKMRVADNKTQAEDGLELIKKVINLNSEQRKLINKLLDASDQCKEIIDIVLSSTNPMLDLLQKVVRADTEELNLLRKITELNRNELELSRKFIFLCNREKYFICKFVDWYLRDQSSDLPCSCSPLKEVDAVEDNAGHLRTVDSSYASQKCENNEKVVTCETNQGASRGELDNSCSEKHFFLTEDCTGNRNNAKNVQLTERCGSSVECRTEKEAQPVKPTMTEQKLMCHEHLISHSNQFSKDMYGKPVSHVEQNDGGFQLKGTKQVADERREGSCSSAVSTLCNTSETQNRTTVHIEMLLNKKSVSPMNENMEVEQEQTLVGETLVLTTGNMDKKVHEPERHFCLPDINKEPLQRSETDINASPLSAVKSTEILSQNEIGGETNQGASRGELDNSCSEKQFFLTEDCTGNRNIAKKVQLTEKCGSSVECRTEKEAQPVKPTMTEQKLMCHEHLISHSNQFSKDMYGKPVSYVEQNDGGFQLKGAKQVGDERHEGSCSSAVTTLCNTSETQNRTTVHIEMLLNKNSISPMIENMEVEQEQTLIGETLVLTTGNMDKKVHEPERHFCLPDINEESLQGSETDINASPLSAVKSTEIPSQNEIGDDCLSQTEGRIESQHDVSWKERDRTVCCKGTEGGSCVLVAGENLSTVLGGEVHNVCSALSEKESMEIISDIHDSVLMTKRIKNSLPENRCSVQSEIEIENTNSNFSGQEFLLHESKVEKWKRTVLDSSRKNDAPFSPGNANVKSENFMTTSRDVTKNGNAHLSGKEIKKISDTHDSLSTVKKGTNSVSVTSSSVQLNINNKCAKLNDSGQKAPPLCNITDKDTVIIPENMKVNSENLMELSGDKSENVAHLSGKESKKIITDTHHSLLTVRSIANSELEESCLDQKEIESEDAESSDHRQEPIHPHKKFRRNKIRTLDDNVVKEVLFSSKNVEVNSEKLRTVSGDKIEEVDAHLTGMENNKISDPHDSFLCRKQYANSVSKKSCPVQLKIGRKNARSNGCGQKPASLRSELEGSKRTALDIRTEKESSVPSENMKVTTKDVRKKSACVYGKGGKKMITDTYSYLLMVKNITNSESEKSCVGKKEIESKDAKSRNHVEKEISVPLKSVKMESQNLRTISREETEKVGRYVFRKKKKERITNYFLRERRNRNSLSDKTCCVQPETESECAQSDFNRKEPVYPQLKLKDTKSAVLDKRTEIYPEIKRKGISPSVILEGKCEEESSVVADHSSTEEADVLQPGSKKDIQPTEEMKLNDDIKHEKMQLCMKKMGFLVEGKNMFNIATSMTQLLNREEKTISPTLMRKTQHFFDEARTIYSSLEKYLHKFQCDKKKRTHEKLSNCASQMLQCLLKLQHTISLRDNKIGMNMKEVIVLITRVMDVIGEVVTIATEEPDTKLLEGFVLNDCCIKLEDIAHMLKGKKTVNLKHIKGSQENRMRHSLTDNITSDFNDCGFREFGGALLKMKRKKDTTHRCYGNNMKKRRTETSENNVCKEDVAHMLKGKKTVNLKHIKESQENRMRQTHTENITSDFNDCDFREFDGELLKMKRDTIRRCYGNNMKRMTKTSENNVCEVFQGHKPVEYEAIEISIPADDEQFEDFIGWDQDSINCELIQPSIRIKVLTSHVPKEISEGVQAPVSYELTEFSTNKPQASVYEESGQHSTNIYQIAVNNEQTEISTDESLVNIKQEITDFETSPITSSGEGIYICEETFTNWQDIVVKEEMTIEPHPDQEMICLASSISTADSGYQNLNADKMSIVVLGCNEGVPEQTQFTSGHEQLEHNVSEIQSQELRHTEGGSHHSVESISSEFMGTLILNEDTAGEFVEQTGSMTLGMIPQFSGKTDIMLRRPWFGTIKKDVNGMAKSSGFHMQPFTVEQIGSLKWTQYTICIDHPYSREVEESPIKKGSFYICEICAKVIHSHWNINRHMKSHFRYSAVTCNYCGTLISGFQNWAKHRQNCVSKGMK